LPVAKVETSDHMHWVLGLLVSLGCSMSSAQIEPYAGKWKTWVLTSGDQLRLSPPPDEAATRAEIAQLKVIAKQRDAATLERIIWWNAGPPGYRWTSIASTSQHFANLSFSHEKMSIFSFGLSHQTAAADGAREIRESGICFVRSLDPAESNSQATD
jgi:hypothetical protein